MKWGIDTLIRIYNGSRVGLLTVKVKNTRYVRSLLSKLYVEGFINGYYKLPNNELLVSLKYVNGNALVRYLSIISTQKRPYFIKSVEVNRFLHDGVFFLLSTSNGIQSSSDFSVKLQDFAVEKRKLVGGILLCKIEANAS